MREMRDSGIAWVKTIPAHWEIKRGKFALSLLDRPVFPDDQVITCFRDGQVTLRANRREEGFTVSMQEAGYQGIEPGDLVVHGMDGFAGAIGVSDSRGKGTPVLNVLDSKYNKRFLMYYLRMIAFVGVFESLSTGIRVRSCDTNWNKLRELPYFLPPLEEQNKIVTYLDNATRDNKELAIQIQKQVDTLEGVKQSIISEAVTKGLNRHAEMQQTKSDEWPQIPVGWSLCDIKYLFEIVKRIAGKEGYDVLSVTQRGLKVKDINSNEGQLADNYSDYQFVYPTDYVMNHMDLLTGWVDCSTLFGVTSPDYRVFRLRDKEKNDLNYYKYVMQCCYMCKIFYSLGNGVSGMGRWRLQTSTFMNFQVPVPPLNEQKEIAQYLDRKIAEIDGAIAIKEQQLETLDAYKKSLIFEYVTGKKEVV